MIVKVGRFVVPVILVAACRQASAPAPRVCLDSMEARAIECSGGAARRVGDTLFVRLENNRDTAFADWQGEAPGGYRYGGRVGSGALHVIEQYGGEAAPRWLVIDPKSGRSILANDKPIFSPDSSRFATAGEGWNNCVESIPGMFVWAMTDSVPELEWKLDPWNCDKHSGWGPTHPVWSGNDTLQFTRHDRDRMGGTRSRPIFAVRDGASWRVVDR